MNTSLKPRSKLRILRLVSYLFHVAGLIMVFPVFKELRTLFPKQFSPEFPYTIFLSMMIATVDLRAGINNDQLVLLPVMISLFFLLRFYRTSAITPGILASLFSALSIWVKFTNGLFLLLSFITLLYLALKKYSFSIKSFFTLMPFLLVPLLFIMNGFLFGWNNILNHQQNKSMLMIFQPGMFDFETFLKLHVLEIFCLNFLWIFHDMHWQLGVFFFLSGLIGLMFSFLSKT